MINDLGQIISDINRSPTGEGIIFSTIYLPTVLMSCCLLFGPISTNLALMSLTHLPKPKTGWSIYIIERIPFTPTR